MTHRSNRLRKKLHRRWLGAMFPELTQDPSLRRRLFESRAHQVFEIGPSDVRSVSLEATLAMEKYKLSFSMSTADPGEAESWLRANGGVIFKFWATDFSTVRRYSGNYRSAQDGST